ncbi:hypothetical protein BU24DRAFT_419904 [Aaosphaeria arxii CBS 175.79]|uniref:Uncharacterized protein n=1 Tax=Aaosphaeria arxii CBS 175.79 TaxID=1450172 RepID=A0A6A5XU53_9PLEO|nr:uncharacterized protein BU24DRAFT_419904 [Aaosphaeria arxii CBS 175.79]KAF2016848.1 hypothetical protein BU24DRAFT_419904 [Aaosphaeria arxii CBS 175.79]
MSTHFNDDDHLHAWSSDGSSILQGQLTPIILYHPANGSSSNTTPEHPASTTPTEHGSAQGFTVGPTGRTAKAPAKQKRAMKPRYYSHALSTQDKEDLAKGKRNHNHPSWTPEDLLRLQESRKGLVPRFHEDCKRLLEERERDIQAAKRYVHEMNRSKVRWFSGLRKALLGRSASLYIANLNQDLKSLESRRSASATTVQTVSTPMTPSVETPREGNTARDGHYRAAGSVDYFSLPIGNAYTCDHAEFGGRLQSSCPVTPISTSFRARPNITFDSFLAPHASGKGEAFRGADNAQPSDLAKGRESDGLRETGASSPIKMLRRVSRVVSMPMLKTRKSPGGQRESLPRAPSAE